MEIHRSLALESTRHELSQKHYKRDLWEPNACTDHSIAVGLGRLEPGPCLCRFWLASRTRPEPQS